MRCQYGQVENDTMRCPAECWCGDDALKGPPPARLDAGRVFGAFLITISMIALGFGLWSLIHVLALFNGG